MPDNSDETYGFKNWRDPGAFTPQGIDGIINSLAFTAFSMQGMEIVGITVRLLYNLVIKWITQCFVYDRLVRLAIHER